MKMEKIDHRYRLLHLIYEGETSGILADRALRESLNDLMKYELITIYNNKLRLTERGKKALKDGFNSAITRVRSKKESEIKLDADSKNLMEFVVTISVLLLIILLVLIL